MFTDSRDGQAYRTVKIGRQIWMAENLNYEADSSWCYHNSDIDSNSYCGKYGRLYAWNAARTACPNGWYLPTREEWDGLMIAIGRKEGYTREYGTKYRIWAGAGKMLKAKSGWKDYTGKDRNGTDDFGFSALPGGSRNINGAFYGIDYRCDWWTATDTNNDYAYYRSIFYTENQVREKKEGKRNGNSVRCVADNP